MSETAKIISSSPQAVTFTSGGAHTAQTVDLLTPYAFSEFRHFSGGQLGVLIKTAGTVGATTLAITASPIVRLPIGSPATMTSVVPTLPAATTLVAALAWTDGAYYLYGVSFIGDTAPISGVRLSFDPSAGVDLVATAWLLSV